MALENFLSQYSPFSSPLQNPLTRQNPVATVFGWKNASKTQSTPKVVIQAATAKWYSDGYASYSTPPTKEDIILPKYNQINTAWDFMKLKPFPKIGMPGVTEPSFDPAYKEDLNDVVSKALWGVKFGAQDIGKIPWYDTPNVPTRATEGKDTSFNAQTPEERAQLDQQVHQDVQKDEGVRSVLSQLGANIMQWDDLATIRQKYPELDGMDDSVLSQLGGNVLQGDDIDTILQKFPELVAIKNNQNYTESQKWSTMNWLLDQAWQSFNEFTQNMKEDDSWLFGPAKWIKNGVLDMTNQVVQGSIWVLKGTYWLTDKAAWQIMKSYAHLTWDRDWEDPYRLTDTSVSQDILNLWEGTINTAMAIWAPLITAWFNLAAQIPWLKNVVEWLAKWTQFAWSIIARVPGLQDFKDSLPEEDQDRFDAFVGNVGIWMLLWVKGKKNIVKNPKQFLIDNMTPTQIARNFQENVLWMPSKWAKVVRDTTWFIKNKTSDLFDLTWLKPEEKAIIEKNPYFKDEIWKLRESVESQWLTPQDHQTQVLQWLTEELISQVDEKIWNLEKTWPLYKEIKNNPKEFAFADAKKWISDMLTNKSIKVNSDWTLDFSESNIGSETDMRKIQRAYDRVMDHWDTSTAARTLNLRQAIDDMAWWEKEATPKASSIIKQMRWIVDNIAKKEVPGLKEADAMFSSQIQELKDIRKWLVDKQWNTLASSYTKVKNSNTLANTVFGDKLEKYFPGTKEKVEAINTATKLWKKIDSPAKLWLWATISAKLIEWTIATAVWSAFWANYWFWALILSHIVEKVVLKGMDSMKRSQIEAIINKITPEQISKLDEIGRQIQARQRISQQNNQFLEETMTMIQDAVGVEKDNKASYQAFLDSIYNDLPKLPEKTDSNNMGTPKNPIVAKMDPNFQPTIKTPDFASMEKIAMDPQDPPKVGYETKMWKVVDTTHNWGAYPKYKVKIEGSDKRFTKEEIGDVYKPKAVNTDNTPVPPKLDPWEQVPAQQIENKPVLNVAKWGKKEYYLKQMKEIYWVDINNVDPVDLPKISEALNSRTPGKAEEIMREMANKYWNKEEFANNPKKDTVDGMKKEKIAYHWSARHTIDSLKELDPSKWSHGSISFTTNKWQADIFWAWNNQFSIDVDSLKIWRLKSYKDLEKIPWYSKNTDYMAKEARDYIKKKWYDAVEFPLMENDWFEWTEIRVIKKIPNKMFKNNIEEKIVDSKKDNSVQKKSEYIRVADADNMTTLDRWWTWYTNKKWLNVVKEMANRWISKGTENNVDLTIKNPLIIDGDTRDWSRALYYKVIEHNNPKTNNILNKKTVDRIEKLRGGVNFTKNGTHEMSAQRVLKEYGYSDAKIKKLIDRYWDGDIMEVVHDILISDDLKSKWYDALVIKDKVWSKHTLKFNKE